MGRRGAPDGAPGRESWLSRRVRVAVGAPSRRHNELRPRRQQAHSSPAGALDRALAEAFPVQAVLVERAEAEAAWMVPKRSGLEGCTGAKLV